MSDTSGEGAVPLDIVAQELLGKDGRERFLDLFPHIAQDLDEVDAQIRAVLPSSYPFLYEAARYAVASGGKRLRPLLILVFYRALGFSSTRPVHPLAASFQLIHTASLVHDDLIDHALLRRGRPTVHHAFGEPAAIITGDYLFVRAFQLAARYPQEIVEMCAEASSDLAQGETMQENSRFDLTLPKERYLEIVMLKTANAFAAGALATGMVAEVDKEVAKSMGDYGRAMGIAFQIKDDLLDIYGDRDRMGKPLFSDFREGLPTYPTILVYERLEGKEKSEFERLFALRRKRSLHLLRLKELCDASDAREVAEREAERWAAAANHALISLPSGPYKELLERLAVGVVERWK